MKIEFPFLWVSRGSKEWGVLLFTIGWVLWALMCAVAIRWDAWKGACGRRQKTQKAPGAENKRPAGYKSLGKTCKGWYGKHERELKKTILAAALYTLLLYMAGSGCFLPEQTALHTAAGKIMQYSVLGMVGLLAAAARSFCLKSGRESWLNFLLQLEGIWTLAVVAAVLLSGTVPLDIGNGVWCWLLCAGAVGSLLYRLEPAAAAARQEDPFGPTTTYAQLIGPRKGEAGRLADWIDANRKKRYSLCVTGEWGSGKTSFLNGVIDKLNQKKKNDCVIWIRAMEMDSLENLLQYLFGEIRRELKKRGAYVGLSSEYQKFLQAAAASLTTQETSGILGTRLFRTPENYREKRDALDKIIQQTMGDSLFLVVVDDIERCENAEKIRQFIAFIREAGTLSNCVPIFLTDYDKLLEQGRENEVDERFFEKFFNRRVELVQVTPEEIMEEMEREKDAGEPLKVQEAFAWPGELYKTVMDGLETKIEGLQREQPPEYARKDGTADAYRKRCAEELRSTEAVRQTLQENFSNPRAVRRFYAALLDDWKRCFCAWCTGEIEEPVRVQNADALDAVRIKEVLWLTAYVQVWHCTEVFPLWQQGTARYFTEGYRQSLDSGAQTLVKNVSGVFFGGSEAAGGSYRRQQLLRQVDAVLQGRGNGDARLISYEERPQKLEEDFKAQRCETMSQEDYTDLLCYVLDKERRDGKQEALLWELFAFAAKKDAEALRKKGESFFPQALNKASYVEYSWYEASNAYRVFYEVYCERENVPGYSIEANASLKLKAYEQKYRMWVLKQLIQLLWAVAQNTEQEYQLRRLEEVDKGLSEKPDELCAEYWDVMCEITQKDWRPPETADLLYSEMLERIEGMLVGSGMLKGRDREREENKILYDLLQKAKRGVENLSSCTDVVEFFQKRKSPQTFESCLKKHNSAEKAVEFLIEAKWENYGVLSYQLQRLRAFCQNNGQTVPPEKLKQLEKRLQDEYEAHKEDLTEQEYFFGAETSIRSMIAAGMQQNKA